MWDKRGKGGQVHLNKLQIDTLFWPTPGADHHSLSSY